MTNLDQQIRDWTAIHILMDVIPIRRGPYKQETIKEMHGLVKNYYFKYKQKYDYHNRPGKEDNLLLPNKD